MILDKKPLTLADVKEHIKELEGKEALVSYLKRFGKLSKEQSAELREKIISLNNPKIKERDIVKLIDFLPKDNEDVNKILSEANLNEEEGHALVEIIKSR